MGGEDKEWKKWKEKGKVRERERDRKRLGPACSCTSTVAELLERVNLLTSTDKGIALP